MHKYSTPNVLEEVGYFLSPSISGENIYDSKVVPTLTMSNVSIVT